MLACPPCQIRKRKRMPNNSLWQTEAAKKWRWLHQNWICDKKSRWQRTENAQVTFFLSVSSLFSLSLCLSLFPCKLHLKMAFEVFRSFVPSHPIQSNSPSSSSFFLQMDAELSRWSNNRACSVRSDQKLNSISEETDSGIWQL